MVAVASSGTAKLTLPADDQIHITREFDAPRHHVYKAFTTPELVKRWWASDLGEVTIAEIDLRVGGTWRYVMVANEGMEVAFHGEYKELIENERIVSTEFYEGAGPDAPPTVNTATFTETDGRTLLTVIVQCPSPEVRNMIIESGMEHGMQKAYDYMEQVAISLQA
ncbi:MAG TPA: SRPBCC family protein [Actinomycetota bacterium]|nr:SRPBCC family protein [Actinomycetota bacterium]